MEATNNQRLRNLLRPELWVLPSLCAVTKVCPDVIRCSANNREELEQGISFRLVAVGEVKHELLIGNVNGATHCI